MTVCAALEVLRTWFENGRLVGDTVTVWLAAKVTANKTKVTISQACPHTSGGFLTENLDRSFVHRAQPKCPRGI